MQPKYLLRSEAARLLGVSTSTLGYWERFGLIKVERTAGGVRLYTKAEVDRVAAARPNAAKAATK